MKVMMKSMYQQKLLVMTKYGIFFVFYCHSKVHHFSRVIYRHKSLPVNSVNPLKCPTKMHKIGVALFQNHPT